MFRPQSIRNIPPVKQTPIPIKFKNNTPTFKGTSPAIIYSTNKERWLPNDVGAIAESVSKTNLQGQAFVVGNGGVVPVNLTGWLSPNTAAQNEVTKSNAVKSVSLVKGVVEDASSIVQAARNWWTTALSIENAPNSALDMASLVTGMKAATGVVDAVRQAKKASEASFVSIEAAPAAKTFLEGQLSSEATQETVRWLEKLRDSLPPQVGMIADMKNAELNFSPEQKASLSGKGIVVTTTRKQWNQAVAEQTEKAIDTQRKHWQPADAEQIDSLGRAFEGSELQALGGRLTVHAAHGRGTSQSINVASSVPPDDQLKLKNLGSQLIPGVLGGKGVKGTELIEQTAKTFEHAVEGNPLAIVHGGRAALAAYDLYQNGKTLKSIFDDVSGSGDLRASCIVLEPKSLSNTVWDGLADGPASVAAAIDMKKRLDAVGNALPVVVNLRNVHELTPQEAQKLSDARINMARTGEELEAAVQSPQRLAMPSGNELQNAHDQALEPAQKHLQIEVSKTEAPPFGEASLSPLENRTEKGHVLPPVGGLEPVSKALPVGELEPVSKAPSVSELPPVGKREAVSTGPSVGKFEPVSKVPPVGERKPVSTGPVVDELEPVSAPKKPLLIEAPRKPLLIEAPRKPLLIEAPRKPLLIEAAKKPLLIEAPKKPLLIEAPRKPLLIEAPKNRPGSGEILAESRQTEKETTGRKHGSPENSKTNGSPGLPSGQKK